MNNITIDQKLWYLSKIKIFESLSQEEMMEITKLTTMVNIPKKTIVQTPYSAPNGFYFVKQGSLRIYTLTEDGKQYTSSIIGMGSTFGDTSYFSLGTKDSYIETMDDTLICTFTTQALDEYLINHPKLLLNITKNLAQHIEEQNIMLQKLALFDIKERLIFWLKKLALEFGLDNGDYTTIDLSLSHQEIANMIGSTRETVSTTLQDLTKQGIIVTARLSISVNKEILMNKESIN